MGTSTSEQRKSNVDMTIGLYSSFCDSLMEKQNLREGLNRLKVVEVVYIASYTDVEHTLEPVRTGYRVTLTYNLFLSPPGAGISALPGHRVVPERACLRRHPAGTTLGPRVPPRTGQNVSPGDQSVHPSPQSAVPRAPVTGGP
ncbi:hypothetical protein B0H10DRAFT_2237149 [Mycena sp. CBHHK59/15]|nr:hypothetical protein B0H10DRAFT_2237149 [Mycena sp. CBHHK59/15]